MSLNRQQRQSVNRRVPTLAQPAIVPTLAPVLLSVVPHGISLGFEQNDTPPVSPGVRVPVQVVGIPGVVRVSTGDLPTSLLLSGDGLTLSLVYPGSVIDASETFAIGPSDPGIRTSTGGYVAPAVIGAAASSPVQRPWSATATGVNDITIDFGGPSPHPFVVDWITFRNFTTNDDPVQAVWNGSTAVLTYSLPVAPGNAINATIVTFNVTLGAVYIPTPGTVIAS